MSRKKHPPSCRLVNPPGMPMVGCAVMSMSSGLVHGIRQPILDEADELLAAIGEVAEPVVGGTAGRQQNHITGRGLSTGPVERFA